MADTYAITARKATTYLIRSACAIISPCEWLGMMISLMQYCGVNAVVLVQ